MPIQYHMSEGVKNGMPELTDPQSFYELVWAIVRQIPHGQVSTYGQIASMIPPPPGVEPVDYERLGPRWVGDAMNAVSRADDPAIPWHRVVNSKGGISLPLESTAANQQRSRLRAEGIAFDMKERIDLNLHGWQGPDAAWLTEHDLRLPKPLRKPPVSSEDGQLRLF